jgi:hypothetical protein
MRAASRAALASGLMAAGGMLGEFPPGYVWGLANCGPSVVRSATACHNCCERAGQNGSLPPDHVAGCDQMCDESVFNPLSFIDRVLLWVFS